MLFALVVGIAEIPERRNLNVDFASGFDIFRYLVHGCLSEKRCGIICVTGEKPSGLA
jgi:hypothetical protein